MRRSLVYRLLAVVVLMVVIVSALAGAFEQVQFKNALNTGTGHTESGGGRFVNSDGKMVVDSDRPSDDELFRVMGSLSTSYLRSDVYTEYDDGGWDNAWAYADYSGQVLDPDNAWGNWVLITVDPIASLTGPLPVAQYTIQVLSDGTDLRYSNEVRTFEAKGSVDDQYTFTYLNFMIRDSEISPVAVAAEPKYYQVPEPLRERLTQLANMIVGDESTPLGKITKLTQYLRTHYEYSFDYPRTPSGQDPVEHFLFNSPQGVCTHFNSALVLMARCLGIPARLCSGYLVDAYSYDQVVYASMSHAYAEIELGENRWVTYDATPGASDPYYVHDPSPSEWSERVVGYTYLDLDNNAARGATEPVLAGRSVGLYSSEGGTLLDLNVSDDSGYFVLDCPSYGYYTVKMFVNEGENAVPSETVNMMVQWSSWVQTDFGIWTYDMTAGTNPTSVSISSVTGSGGGAYAGSTTFDKDRPVTVTGTVSSSYSIAGCVVQVFLVSEDNARRALIGEATVTDMQSFTATCMCPWSLPLGDYQLVARIRATEQFASSQASQAVKVAETCNIWIEGNDQFFADEGVAYRVHVNGTVSGPGVNNTEVFIDLPGYGYVNTGTEGYVTVLIPAGAPGQHPFSVSYNGTAYRSPASTYFNAEGLANSVDVMTADLVRGENSSIIGRVHAGDLVRNTNITVLIEDAQRSVVFAGGYMCGELGGGLFTFQFLLPDDLELGAYRQTITTSDGQVIESTVSVLGRPDLNLTVSGRDVAVRLLDDTGAPLTGQSVLITAGKENWTITTDELGEGQIRSGNALSRVTAAYAGSTLYLPSQRTLVLDMSLTYQALALLLALSAAAFVLIVCLIRWWSSRGAAAPDDGTSSDGRYLIRSESTARGLPLVWGEGEQVTITIEGKKGGIKLLVDGEVRRAKVGDTITLDLAKGEHLVEVRGLLGRRKAMIRVVNFREEVSRVFLATKAVSDAGSARSSSAREYLAAAQAHRDVVDPDVLVEVFERAEYSSHDVRRTDYERAFLSSRRVRR